MLLDCLSVTTIGCSFSVFYASNLTSTLRLKCILLTNLQLNMQLMMVAMFFFAVMPVNVCLKKILNEK